MERENFKFMKLAAAIGLYFAKVDNDYDEKEKEFIVNYIGKLKENISLTADEEAELKATDEHHYTLDEIIAGTNDLLDEYVATERYPLLNTLSVMINQVINADGVVKKEEAESFAKWKEVFGVK